MDERQITLRDYLAGYVTEGFIGTRQIMDHATTYAEENLDWFDASSFIEQTTRELIEAHAAEEQTWVTPTDCDKLDAAFNHLELHGILARSNYTCCMNCGTTEIAYEIVESTTKVRGYVFYHNQDTERAIENRNLRLAFGSADETLHSTTTIGWQIVDALNAQGLQVEWNGNPDVRIKLVNFEWKRRRTHLN